MMNFNSLQMFSGKCSDQLVVFNLIFPVKCTVSVSHNFSSTDPGKIETDIFTIFAFSLSGQKLNSKNAIRFFVHPNFLWLLKSRKTEEDLKYAVETSRSISTWQSRDKLLTKRFKFLRFPWSCQLAVVFVVHKTHNVIPPFCSDALAVPALDVRHDRSSARSACFVGSIFACVSSVYYQTEESVMNVRSSWNPLRENTNLKLTQIKCSFII